MNIPYHCISLLAYPLTLFVQVILQEYVQTEMLFHAKALELLTLSYQHMESVDVDEAIEVTHNAHTIIPYIS